MSHSKKLFKGAAILTLGRMAGMGFSFLRNLILARILAKADYGLAAAFSMAVTLLEFAGSMSFGMQIVQSPHGNCESYQNTSHAFQFVVAGFSALSMLVLAQPMAYAFHVPQLGWAFALLAFIPLSRGLEHLDNFRRQRDMEYLPVVFCDVVPQAVVTVAAWPMALWLGDYRVIIFLMLAKSVLSILLTHLLARRSYRWAWRSDYLRGMLHFGWPLLLNGFLMFGSQQADQMMVGAWYSLDELADYSLAFSLVSIPGMLFAQVASSLMLPVLSRCQDDSQAFRHYYRRCMEQAALVVAVVLFPVMVLGGKLVTLLYGAKYAGTGLLVAVLGAAFSCRILRVTPVIASMARADSRNQMYSNIWRCAGLPVALFAAASGCPVVWVAACGLIGEGFAALSSLRRLALSHGVPLSESRNAFLFLGVGLVAVAAFHSAGGERWGLPLTVIAVLTVFAGMVVAAALLLPDAIVEVCRLFLPLWARWRKAPVL